MNFRKLILAVLTLALSASLLSACGTNPPELSAVKDELVALVEGSYEINSIFFGEGLPTYGRGGEYDKEYRLYDSTSAEFDYYEYVTQDSSYQFTEQIKVAAEKVYTAEYLKGIYTMAFDGYADENSDEVVTARYLEAGSWLMKYSFGETDPFNILPGKRVYDFDTMEIVKPSNAGYLNVEVDSHLEGEDSVMKVTLRFKLTEDGWRLDAPTY